jgi:hypothetical protein
LDVNSRWDNSSVRLSRWKEQLPRHVMMRYLRVRRTADFGFDPNTSTGEDRTLLPERPIHRRRTLLKLALCGQNWRQVFVGHTIEDVWAFEYIQDVRAD